MRPSLDLHLILTPTLRRLRSGVRRYGSALWLQTSNTSNPTLIPDTAPSSRCRARCLNLRSQTISAFPFRCFFPTPPASLRRRAHSITIRSATSACFSDSSMPVCYFPNSEAHGRHTHDTFLPPIEVQPTAFQLTATFHLTSATPHSTPCRAKRIIRSVRVGILPPSIAPPTTPLRFNPRSHEWRGQFVG